MLTTWDAFCNVWVFIGMAAAGKFKLSRREMRLLDEQVAAKRLGWLL